MSKPDVALQAGGTLVGQVVDHSGQGLANTQIELTCGKQHWRTCSDQSGQFQLQGLRGGSYVLRCDDQAQALRAWTPGTAPPSARQGVLLAPASQLVRGQHSVGPRTNQYFSKAKHYLADPLVFTGVVATAVAIPVAIHNGSDSPPATP